MVIAAMQLLLRYFFMKGSLCMDSFPCEILEQKVVSKSTTACIYKQGDRITDVKGVCSGHASFCDLLLEIAAERITKQHTICVSSTVCVQDVY